MANPPLVTLVFLLFCLLIKHYKLRLSLLQYLDWKGSEKAFYAAFTQPYSIPRFLLTFDKEQTPMIYSYASSVRNFPFIIPFPASPFLSSPSPT